jgi:SAM-dependent methyltransferase
LYDVRVSAEYVDDLPYVRHFIADLSPARLRLVAALNGLVPPPEADFDYCELGCAHGDTLAALAAAYPESRFLGVDLSAAHVASAKRLARDGALENVGVLERDFADLVSEDIGEFDYIVAHGVLSWVSPEKRRALLDFAKAKLKPGGLLHVSYNAMPGWASVEPLRQLLLFGGASGAAPAGTSLERARLGLAFAQSMEGAGAEYFAKNPASSEMLETMAKAGLPYIVHEYLHEHWTPMYFARVTWEMAASNLHFVGGLPVHTNFRDASVSEAQERLLAPVTDRATFESLKDFANDEFFRRDVFVLGTPPRSAAATKHFLETTTWGPLAGALPVERTVALPHRTVSLAGAELDAVFAALAAAPATLSVLAARPELAAMGLDALHGALIRLIVAEQLIPMRDPAPRAVADDGDLYRVPSVYNQTMLRRLSTDTPLVMVSSVAGTAFPVSALEGLAIRVMTEVAPADRERWVDAHVGRSVLRIRVGERVLEDREAQRRAILDAVEQLRGRLPKLVELGILAPANAPR